MRERTRQRLLAEKLLADTGTMDESLPTTSGTGPQRRKYTPMADRTFTAAQRAAYAKSGVALPDGSYPIPDRDALDRAIRSIGRGSAPKAEIKSHIIKRAKALGATSMLPDDWNVTAEAPMLAPILMLEAAGEPIQIVAEGGQEGSTLPEGVMRLRVPWYVGNSVARIHGFEKKIYFPGSILADTVAKGNATIGARMPGMTSYARHAHAVTKNEIPAGDVVALEQDGNKGYATVDVNATRWGQDIQALARANQLRATSLRSSDFQVAERKVNGEAMLEATAISVDGIDFAPDGAAMPTYGVEVLAAEAAVEPAPTSQPRRDTMMEDITSDGLRAEYPQIVKEIESPLQAKLDELQAKVDSLVQAEQARDREALVAEIAAKFPNPDEALPELQKLCAEATTADEVAAKAMPVLLEALSAAKTETEPSPREKLLSLFPGSGRGQVIAAETAGEEAEAGPNIDGFAVPAN